jgi:hypothetical protein
MTFSRLRNRSLAALALCMYLAIIAAGSSHQVLSGHGVCGAIGVACCEHEHQKSCGSGHDAHEHHDDHDAPNSDSQSQGSEGAHDCFLCKSLIASALPFTWCTLALHAELDVQQTLPSLAILRAGGAEQVLVRGPPVAAL